MSYLYLIIKDVAYYYTFIDNKLYCESYNNVYNRYEHNLCGAAVLYYKDNTISKYYYINNAQVDVNNDLEFSKYVKGLILK
jgi:hypothetical protein